jgi:NAD(P)-dependent dehydrogenase (short-subunit alcohol dehydrogenase family)
VLADELRGTGIRVNSVNPGAIATDMRREAYPAEDQAKLKQPHDILDVFFYLASDESRNVSGQKLDAQNHHHTWKVN